MKILLAILFSFLLLSPAAFAQSKSQHTLKDYEIVPGCSDGGRRPLVQQLTDVIRKGQVIATISQPATEIWDNSINKPLKDSGYENLKSLLTYCNGYIDENTDKWKVYCPRISYFTAVHFFRDTKEESVETALKECLPK
ncbi:MAG: hypothetical protein LBF41_03850 [Deltaproteobacteria bacterium]|jgi:hypothetical protein|nr:hypothetical protein [Deltaproteobacteria bacterium]